MKYKTNDNILLGMVYTYSFLTINLGVKLPFINQDDELFNQNDIVNLGLNGGYAHTFVWDEKLYLSLWTMFGVSGAYHRAHYTPDSYTLSKGFSVGFTNNTKIS